jgi:DNA adenine methylase
MKYLGGKSRLGARIGEELMWLLGDRHFYEPFVGGFNIAQHVDCKYVYCSDVHPALISMYNAIKKGWVPPREADEVDYYEAKMYEDSNPLKAFLGFGCSFGGKYYGGWARGKTRDSYCREAYNAIMNKRSTIERCYFKCCNYSDITPWAPSLIYCDPPYAGTTGYTHEFNHERFWAWCQHMSKEHIVVVSEFECPVPHELLFEKERVTDVGQLEKTEILVRIK